MLTGYRYSAVGAQSSVFFNEIAKKNLAASRRKLLKKTAKKTRRFAPKLLKKTAKKTSRKFIKFVDFQWQINVFDHIFAPNRRAAAIFFKPTTVGSVFALILALLCSKKLGRLMAPGLKIAKKILLKKLGASRRNC